MTDKPSPKTIIRRQHDKDNPYFMMARDVAQNADLSYEAIGLLAYLLSKPDNWKIIVSDLQRPGCGRDKTIRLLKELTDAGHLRREHGQDEKGRFFYGDYVVTERPVTENPFTDNPLTVCPLAAEPLTVNPTLQNIDIQTTELQSTEANEREKESTPLAASVPAMSTSSEKITPEQQAEARNTFEALVAKFDGNSKQKPFTDAELQAQVAIIQAKYGNKPVEVQP